MKTSPPQAPKSASSSSSDLNLSSLKSRLGKKVPKVLEQLAQSADLIQLAHNWELYARPHQIPSHEDWQIWLLLGGRGCGKTRTGAEWIRAQVADYGRRRIALVAPTYNDVREVMLEGESGLLNIGYPSERPKYISSRRRLEWPNGALGYVFTSEEPDGLRGPQFDAAWADEFCVWNKPEDTLSNLRLALRLGTSPQLVITTTPKPIKALKTLLATPGVLISRGKTSDNADFLAPSFLSAMQDVYGGTRLGRQELEGELIEDISGTLWSRDMLARCYDGNVPQLSKIIIAIDPPVTSGPRADSCGIIIAGVAERGRGAKAYILHDGSLEGASPKTWAQAACALWQSWEADYILAETNQGGDLVATIINDIEPHILVKNVFARKGKRARAEPVAALYEQGRVVHCGRFRALEDELSLIGTEGQKSSPDRADALVWAVTELLLRKSSQPIIRQL